MNPLRFKVTYGSETIGDYPSMWEAHQAAVAYMRDHYVSPVIITDTAQTEYNISEVHIYAYEGPPEVVAARMKLREYEKGTVA